MQIQKLPISQVKQHPRNVRIHTKKNIDVIKKSLQEYGQVKPILVQKSTNYVIAGNGTLQAAISLGWTQILCNILDLDDDKANALGILDNKSTDLSQWDQKGLLQLLQELQTSEENLLQLTGFQNEDIQAMLKFQQGNLFEQKPKKQKKQKKEVKIEQNSYQNQIQFVLMGFPYVNDDEQQILQLKHLTQLLIDSDNQTKQDVTKHIYNAIQQVLTNQFLR